MNRAVLLVTVAACASLATLLGGSFRSAPGTDTTRSGDAPATAVTESLQAGIGGVDTAALVRDLEREVADGAAPERVTLLGLAYQQRARETGDPGFYGLSERALRRALRSTPGDATALGGLGSLALARHRFRDALTFGRRALRRAPYSAHAYGVVGDALLELGRYDEAFATFDRMAAVKPGLAAYARVSYGRELIGDLDGAARAMQMAVDSTLERGEPAAWALTQLGKLHFGRGEHARAGRDARRALAAFAGYPAALELLARSEAAAGRLGPALAHAQRAVDAVPLPQFAATLGDLQARAGRTDLAMRQRDVVAAISRSLEAVGVRTDLETAVFDLDHGIRLGDALRRARAGRLARPSIVGDDTLSWALARNGHCDEAVSWSKRALRLGTRDALLFFHRGYAERCAGRPAAARTWFRMALDLDPHFSLRWAPRAQRWAT